MRFLLVLALLTTSLATLDVLRADWYYRNCNTYILKNAAITSSCKSEKGGRGARKGRLSPKQLQCYCNLDNYRLSAFACIQYAANAAGTKEKSVKESWGFLEHSCAPFADPKTLDYALNKKAYEAANITQGFKQANQTATGPFLPDERSMSASTCKEYAAVRNQRYWAQLYPLITTWYIAGIMFLQTLVHWSTFLIPSLVRLLNNSLLGRQLRRRAVLPAIFSKYRAAPLKVGRWFVLVFPPRLHAIFITGYLFLSVFFLAFGYTPGDDSVDRATFVGKFLGLRSGQLGMHKMMWVFLFAGRNNILIWLTGWQFEIFNHWHRWVSRLLTVDIIAHTVAYAINLRNRGRLPHEWSRTYMIYGLVALVAMCVLCVNGTKAVRQLGYEFFLYFHILLAIASIVGAWWHIEKSTGMKELYAVIAFWAFDRLMRFLRIFLSNPMSKGTLTAYPDGTLSIDISYSGLWTPKAGTYIFIHFMHPLYFFQSHPFTIVPLEEKGKMRLYCKSLKGITKTMYKRAIKNGGSVESRLLIEGPYGVEFATKQFKEIVMVAGGIGITAIYSHLKQIVKNGGTQAIYIHWVMSNDAPLSWFRKELEEMMACENINVAVYVKTTGISPESSLSSAEKKADYEKDSADSSTLSIPHMNRVNFKPQLNVIIKDHITNSRGDIVFFVCGPGSMSDAVREGVATNMFDTRNYVEFFEESFTM